MIAQPIWQQIAGSLRDQIALGTLRPGEVVPTEARLAQAFGASRGTVRQALAELENAGLITGGRPRRVARTEPLTVHVTRAADRTSPGESPTVGADSFLGDMAAAGRETAQQIQVSTWAADEPVTRRLGMPARGIVIARRLVREAGGSPHNLITFWFPLVTAQGTPLALPASIEEGSLSWLEKTYGPLQHDPVDVTARMPLPEESMELAIGSGVPVLIVWRVSRAPDRALVASMAVYPADRTRLALEL